MVLRERRDRYTAVGVQTPSLAGRDVVSRDHGDSVGVKRVRLRIMAAPHRGQAAPTYRYRPPRRRSRQQAALPPG
jgi:hypothetical protein